MFVLELVDVGGTSGDKVTCCACHVCVPVWRAPLQIAPGGDYDAEAKAQEAQKNNENPYLTVTVSELLQNRLVAGKWIDGDVVGLRFTLYDPETSQRAQRDIPTTTAALIQMVGDRVDLLLESQRFELVKHIVQNRLVLGPADAMKYFHSTVGALVADAEKEYKDALQKKRDAEEAMEDMTKRAEFLSRKEGKDANEMLRKIAGEADAEAALKAVIGDIYAAETAAADAARQRDELEKVKLEQEGRIERAKEVITLLQRRAFSVLFKRNRLGGDEKITPMFATGRRWEQEQRWRNIFFANGGAAPDGRGVKLGTHGVKVDEIMLLITVFDMSDLQDVIPPDTKDGQGAWLAGVFALVSVEVDSSSLFLFVNRFHGGSV